MSSGSHFDIDLPKEIPPYPRLALQSRHPQRQHLPDNLWLPRGRPASRSRYNSSSSSATTHNSPCYSFSEVVSAWLEPWHLHLVAEQPSPLSLSCTTCLSWHNRDSPSSSPQPNYPPRANNWLSQGHLSSEASHPGKSARRPATDCQPADNTPTQYGATGSHNITMNAYPHAQIDARQRNHAITSYLAPIQAQRSQSCGCGRYSFLAICGHYDCPLLTAVA